MQHDPVEPGLAQMLRGLLDRRMHGEDFAPAHFVRRNRSTRVTELTRRRPERRRRGAQRLPLTIPAPPVEDLAEDLAAGGMDGIGENAKRRNVLGRVRRRLTSASPLVRDQRDDHQPASAILDALRTVRDEVVARLGANAQGAAVRSEKESVGELNRAELDGAEDVWILRVHRAFVRISRRP